MSEALSELKGYKVKIDKALEDFLNREISHYSNLAPSSKEMAETVAEYNLRGGKRIRPALMIAAYKCLGGEDEENIIKASLSIELLEGYLLMHDDIMDEDEMRRGKSTVHRIFRERHEERYKIGNAAHFGSHGGKVEGTCQCHCGFCLGNGYPGSH